MTDIYIDQRDQIVPRCSVCRFWRATHGDLCEADAYDLRDACNPHGMVRPYIGRGGA